MFLVVVEGATAQRVTKSLERELLDDDVLPKSVFWPPFCVNISRKEFDESWSG
jgi:hypothetical protein